MRLVVKGAITRRRFERFLDLHPQFRDFYAQEFSPAERFARFTDDGLLSRSPDWDAPRELFRLADGTYLFPAALSLVAPLSLRGYRWWAEQLARRRRAPLHGVVPWQADTHEHLRRRYTQLPTTCCEPKPGFESWDIEYCVIPAAPVPGGGEPGAPTPVVVRVHVVTSSQQRQGRTVTIQRAYATVLKLRKVRDFVVWQVV